MKWDTFVRPIGRTWHDLLTLFMACYKVMIVYLQTYIGAIPGGKGRDRNKFIFKVHFRWSFVVHVVRRLPNRWRHVSTIQIDRADEASHFPPIDNKCNRNNTKQHFNMRFVLLGS